MTEYTWPLDLKPYRMSFYLQWNVSETRSPFTRKRQTLKRDGERWSAEMEVEAHAEDTGRIDAFLSQLEGPIHTVLLPDFRRLTPNGANRAADTFASLTGTQEFADSTDFTDGTAFTTSGEPRISFGAAAGSTSIQTDGWYPNETALKAGDYLKIGSQMVIVIEDVAADGNGEATVSFRPPLKADAPVHDGDPANPTTFERENVRASMHLVSVDDPENPTQPPVISTYRLRFEGSVD